MWENEPHKILLLPFHGISRERRLQITMSFTGINYTVCSMYVIGTHTHSHLKCSNDRSLTLLSALTDSCCETFQSLLLSCSVYNLFFVMFGPLIIPYTLVIDLRPVSGAPCHFGWLMFSHICCDIMDSDTLSLIVSFSLWLQHISWVVWQ